MKNVILKKFRSVLAAAMILVIAAAGSRPATVFADENYGDDAYYYMQYLQTNYPYRAVNTQVLASAREYLTSQVKTMGYDYTSQPYTVNDKNGNAVYGENIIFSKQGTSDRVIVVGAHYDSVAQTFGADDNASGVGVLLETANRYSAKNPQNTIRFILFSAEEPGCLGSQYYVDNLSQEERDSIACMVNLDTLGGGDNMYLYGGGIDDAGNPIRTWAVDQALADAQTLGLAMSFHPDVNSNYPVPVKHTASDQTAFNNAGIPYVYFEASNWNGGAYTNFFQTSHEGIPNGTMIHVPEFDNLTFYTNTFGTRMFEHLKSYSQLLDYFIENFSEGSETAAETSLTYEECSDSARALQDVNLRSKPSTSGEILTLLNAGAEVTVTGFNSSWCRVEYDGQEGYVKSEFLEISTDEENSEEETQTSETETAEAEYASREEVSEAESIEAETELQSDEDIVLRSTAEAETEETTQGAVGNSISDNSSDNPVSSIIDKIKSDPMALRIILIAVIVIICIWVCVIIALKQKRASRNRDDSNAEEDEENFYIENDGDVSDDDNELNDDDLDDVYDEDPEAEDIEDDYLDYYDDEFFSENSSSDDK